MSVPHLYLEGLMQRALLGDARLNAYKLGIIEAILKEALSVDTGEEDLELVRSRVGTALEVARWEMPRPKPSGAEPKPDG